MGALVSKFYKFHLGEVVTTNPTVANNNIRIEGVKPVKDEPKGTSNPPSRSTQAPATGPVREDEIRVVFRQKTQITTRDLVMKFKGRLTTKEDKNAFAAMMRKIFRIEKMNGNNYVVLREQGQGLCHQELLLGH